MTSFFKELIDFFILLLSQNGVFDSFHLLFVSLLVVLVVVGVVSYFLRGFKL